jgi:uncharacterized protein YxeA
MAKKEAMKQYTERRKREAEQEVYNKGFKKDPYEVMFDKKKKGNQYAKLRGI